MSDALDRLFVLAKGSGLPADLPPEPFAIFREWMQQAKAANATPNPDAMSLATVSPDGSPHARIVLCKHIDAELGAVRFFTNYTSPKAKDLDSARRAACAILFDAQHRQVRLEGIIRTLTPAESDEYFATRALLSRLGAWASKQSTPLSSREELVAAVREAANRHAVSVIDLIRGESNTPVPRPPFWGGYRLYATRVELWSGGDGRLHDRAEWTRTLRTDEITPTFSDWSAQRLYP